MSEDGQVNQSLPKFYPNNFSVGDYLKAKKLIEKQLADSSKNASKPSPNAVPVGFQTTASRLASQVFPFYFLNQYILFLIT